LRDSTRILSCLESKGNFPINIRKGESIHHPQHGIGRIQSIGERSFGGCAKATYAELYFERHNLKLTILKDDVPNTVRSLISNKEAKRLLEEIKSYDGKVSKQWKARANAHQAAIDRGDPFEYAKVYKGLTKLEEKDGLRAQDKAHLAQSLDLLTEELSCSLRKSREQTRKMLADVAS
jgi:RNA polymerase-interacting CarD/CdnL/TRCF family regulator